MCTTLTRRGCAFTATLDVQYQNNSGLTAGAFTALVNGWDAATEGMWNGPAGHQHYGCCTVEFAVITRIGAGRAASHQINVVAGPQTSFVSALGPGCTTGRWDAQDTGNVAAHESGHLLGLPDEYDYNGPGGAYRNLNPQPADQPQSIMAQTWGNVAALQSHIDALMQGLNASCPWWCCILWPVHRLLDVLRLAVAVPLLVTADLPSPEEVSTVPAKPADPSPRDALEQVRDGRPSSLMDAVRVLTDAGKESNELAQVATGDESPLVRWVGLVVADTLGDVDTVETGLEDDDLRLRVTAAAALARRGQRQVVPVLIEGLGSNQVAIGHPPELLASFAEQALITLSGESISTTDDSPEARTARWQRWADTAE